MFKLFKGELKKIVLRPGIYIMVALLVLAMVLAPMLFSPASRTDAKILIDNPTVATRYTYFTTNIQSVRDENRIARVDIIEDILGNPDRNVLRDEILAGYAYSDVITVPLPVTLKDFYRKFEALAGVDLPVDINPIRTQLEESVLGMKTKATALFSKYTSVIGNETPLLLVTEQTNEKIKDALDGLLQTIDMFGAPPLERGDYINMRARITVQFRYIETLDNAFADIKNIEYDTESLNKVYKDYYIVDGADKSVSARLTTLNSEMLAMALDPTIVDTDPEPKKNIDEKIWAYDMLSKNVTKILHNSILLSAAEGKTDAEMSGYLGFKDFNVYKTTEELTKYQYLFDNNKADYDYANVFAFGTKSNFDDSAFDFIYFVLEIFSFIIIAYGVVLGAGMIAGEQSGGTIKLLAIRPYKRGKIMFSKMMTAFFFVSLFTVLSAGIAVIASLIIYGSLALTSLPVLVIFNATIPFTINAWVLLLIYLATIIIKAWIFVLLAFAISTLFKSHVGAVIISTLLYLISMIVTFVASGANWLKYNVFANLDFFKYFGGSFTNSYKTDDTFNNLFLNPVFADTSIIYTAIVVGALLLVLNIITFAVFKRRDIT